MARDDATPRAAERARAGASSRIAGLDGLRALAVVAVLLFHADLPWARGGYLGVDLFFVLSGFLITGLLADETEGAGRVDYRRFYWRRAKRLLPAVWLMIGCTTLAAAWFAADALPRLRGDALASAFFLTNWEMVRANASYFESTGRAPLLQHLWSLAIEEQFYIVWALFIPFGLRAMTRRRLAVVALALAAASAAWMAVLAWKLGYPGQGDPSRLYFGTDTHGFPLLIGAALGLAWRPGRARSIDPPALRAIGWIVGLAALVGLMALFARMGEENALLYPWGFLLASAAGAMLIMTASHPGLAFGRWLDTGLLRWIGHRSYGIYLWHWPIFMLTRPGLDLPGWNEHAVLVLRLGLTLAIAALSYRYVEMPIRHGALESLWRQRRATATRVRGWLGLTAIAGTTLAGVLVVAHVLWKAPAQAVPAEDVQAAFAFLDVEGREDVEIAPDGVLDVPVEAVVEAPVEAVALPVDPMLEPLPEGPVAETFDGRALTAIGDSVLLGSSPVLKAALAGVDLHAAMGWQAADVISQLRQLKDAGQLRPVALVHLGTNGYVYESQLRQILAMLGDAKRVILVNTQVPRRWMRHNNELIDRVTPEFANVVVVRWSDISSAQPDFFISDGYHMTPRGQRVFIANIMRAGDLVSGRSATGSQPDAIDPGEDYPVQAGDLSPTLVLAARPAPSESYWHRLARCETDSDWQGGQASGGLDITPELWSAWGGTQFAPTAAEATPAQQIEVANRLSTQGWQRPDGGFDPPVGFSRWRCIVAHHPPRARGPDGLALTYTAQSVLAQSFRAGQRGEVVRDLQTILGVHADGIYDRGTRRKHLSYLQEHALPEELAGSDS